jgi:hypothetical protein
MILYNANGNITTAPDEEQQLRDFTSNMPHGDALFVREVYHYCARHPVYPDSLVTTIQSNALALVIYTNLLSTECDHAVNAEVVCRKCLVKALKAYNIETRKLKKAAIAFESESKVKWFD